MSSAFVPLALYGVIIAARIIMHGAVVVATGGVIGAGKILYAVDEIGLGIPQAFSSARVAKARRGRELDLHQPDGAAAADQRRLVSALAHDHPMYQSFRHAVRLGMGRDQRLILRTLLLLLLRTRAAR